MGKAGAKNAGYLAAQIMAVSDPALADKAIGRTAITLRTAVYGRWYSPSVQDSPHASLARTRMPGLLAQRDDHMDALEGQCDAVGACAAGLGQPSGISPDPNSAGFPAHDRAGV